MEKVAMAAGRAALTVGVVGLGVFLGLWFYDRASAPK